MTRFVYAASEHDFVAMLQAFEEMGVKLNRFDPSEVRRGYSIKQYLIVCDLSCYKFHFCTCSTPMW